MVASSFPRNPQQENPCTCVGLEEHGDSQATAHFRILLSTSRVELPAPPHHEQSALSHGGLAASIKSDK